MGRIIIRKTINVAVKAECVDVYNRNTYLGTLVVTAGRLCPTERFSPRADSIKAIETALGMGPAVRRTRHTGCRNQREQ